MGGRYSWGTSKSAGDCTGHFLDELRRYSSALRVALLELESRAISKSPRFPLLMGHSGNTKSRLIYPQPPILSFNGGQRNRVDLTLPPFRYRRAGHSEDRPK